MKEIHLAYNILLYFNGVAYYIYSVKVKIMKKKKKIKEPEQFQRVAEKFQEQVYYDRLTCQRDSRSDFNTTR